MRRWYAVLTADPAWREQGFVLISVFLIMVGFAISLSGQWMGKILMVVGVLDLVVAVMLLRKKRRSRFE
jgi:uncharacterized membrane protein SirB2